MLMHEDRCLYTNKIHNAVKYLFGSIRFHMLPSTTYPLMLSFSNLEKKKSAVERVKDQLKRLEVQATDKVSTLQAQTTSAIV